MYSKKVIAHFTNPHNAGEMQDPDGIGEVGNPTCGDMMRIFIKVENDRLKDIKFQTFGCAAAIATSSIMTDMAMGKNIVDAFKITRQNVADELGGLPAAKMHCSNLASDGLKVAINDFLKKKNRPPLGPEGDDAEKCETQEDPDNE
nr:Fe-S cluster assembly scaffold protein NifU [Candidatus Sigynarchaeota archaeon]